MKTILSLLLLPMLVFGQPQGQHHTAHFNFEFLMDLESIIKNEIDFMENPDGVLELFITVEIYVEELFIDTRRQGNFTYETATYALPKFLNTFSLVGLSPNETGYPDPQKRLNRLLALNNPMFPKENTLVDWLQPVRYQQNKLGGAENMPEGFGPRIRL